MLYWVSKTKIFPSTQEFLLVSLRPARKLDDHDGGLILNISKNNSKIVSRTLGEGMNKASTNDRGARRSYIDNARSPAGS